MENKIEINGIYKHYKGNRYKVLNIAIHTETLEEMVVYQALYGDNLVYTRPLKMFLEKVIITKNQSGYTLTANVDRFKKI